MFSKVKLFREFFESLFIIKMPCKTFYTHFGSEEKNIFFKPVWQIYQCFSRYSRGIKNIIFSKRHPVVLIKKTSE
jgi:hypothetical protein